MKSEVVERLLSNGGWEYEHRERVNVRAVSDEPGALAQIRLADKVDMDHVARLELVYRHGGQPPDIVLARVGSTLRVADGIHRLAAMRQASVAETDAYVVTNADDPSQLDILRRTMNVPVKPISAQEAVLHAVAIYDRAGGNLTIANVAKMVYVDDSAVGRYLRARETRKRLARLVPGLGNLPMTTLEALNQVKRDEVLALAARVSSRIGAIDARSLAREAARAVTDKQARDLLADWKARFSAELKGPATPAFPAVKDAAIVKLDRLMTTTRAVLTRWKNFNVEALHGKTRREAREFLADAGLELIAKSDGHGAGPVVRAQASRGGAPRRASSGRPRGRAARVGV